MTVVPDVSPVMILNRQGKTNKSKHKKERIIVIEKIMVDTCLSVEILYQFSQNQQPVPEEGLEAIRPY